ncbi:coiled-coil domain-containing protein 149 [Choristoneura fumiferana]|uniref:coiled-coil domain-containing protein 149 n=1 Tax=Choristoneura fumiferana TaxID=7141 RepID=UPI003D15B0B1
MFKSANSKVKFQDPQLDDYILENSVLKSKLQSKIDALSIMGKELDKCSMERDKYKLLVEQMKSVRSTPSQENNSVYRLTPSYTESGGELLAKTRELNDSLKLEVETLKSKLEEATGDIVALRKQLQKKDPEDIYCCRKSSTSLSCSPNDYEQLVQDLEKIHKKYEQLQLDYRATLDEKEELVSDRDYYKNKVQRLNHQISYILANRVKSQQADRDPNAPNPVVDLDAVVMENKYLHERINQLQVEKEIIKRTLTKYKTLLENRTNSNMFHLSKGFADVMTPKQVREYLDVNSKGGSKRTSAGELKSICLGLFEALNDKSTALQHQRKTNQILANRITELEKTMESWCDGQKYIPIFPSQMLLDEFCPENVSVMSQDSRQKYPNEEETGDGKNKLSDSDDDVKEISDSSSEDLRSNYEFDEDVDKKLTSKTVLPLELEELVKEARAEMKASS